MCSSAGLMRSILIIMAGLPSAGQLMFCDCTEEAGLDWKMDLGGLLFLCGLRLPLCLMPVRVIPESLSVIEVRTLWAPDQSELYVIEFRCSCLYSHVFLVLRPPLCVFKLT